MQIGSINHRYSPAPIKSASITDNAAQTKATKSTGSAASVEGALFANGLLSNSSGLLSADTLSSLFEMNSDGTPKVSSDAPVLQLKKGVSITSPQEAITNLLAMAKFAPQADQSGSMSGAYANITDDDKAMFREVTGYNLLTVGGDAMIVDDNGNFPTGPDKAAANELFQRMTYARSQGQAIDKDWFEGVSQDLKNWNGPTFSADWEARATSWFDDVQASRKRTAATAEEVAASSSASAQNSVLEAQKGIAAYQAAEAAAQGAAAG